MAHADARLKKIRDKMVGPRPAVAGPHPADPVIDHAEIARLAYSYWEDRGFSGGSAQEDWHRAEEELKSRAGSSSKAGLRRKIHATQ